MPTLTSRLDDTKVSNPYGYGYIGSLNETRGKDAVDILNYEQTLFALGAITGVSVIVIGILITSNSNASK
jgi:hypothetical protein